MVSYCQGTCYKPRNLSLSSANKWDRWESPLGGQAIFRQKMPYNRGMRWIRTNWTLFSILTLIFGAGWIVFTPPSRQAVTGGRIPAPGEGFLAPDFTLQNTDGETVRLSDLKGKVVLLNLWASWCPPCKAEMPAMQRVFQQYQGEGFLILAVNATAQDDRESALKFASSLGLTFPILFDLDGAVSQKYQVHSMPTSFFIDTEGTIQRVVIGGPMSEALLRAEVERLLNSAKTAQEAP